MLTRNKCKNVGRNRLYKYIKTENFDVNYGRQIKRTQLHRHKRKFVRTVEFNVR